MSIPSPFKLLFLAILLTQPGGAAESSATATKPIPVSMIAPEAESASIRVHRIEHEMNAALRLGNVQSQLVERGKVLERFGPLLESGAAAHMDELLNLRQELRRLRLQVLKLQGDLNPRLQAIEARRDELLKMEQLWYRTSDSLKSPEIPTATRELVLGILQEIRTVLSKIAVSRPEILAIQGEISSQRIDINNLLAQTDAAISDCKARLFTIDSEPLWKTIASLSVSASLTDSARLFYHRRALPLFEYLRTQKELLLSHFLGSILLIGFLVAVTRNSRLWFDAKEVADKAGQVLLHPVAAALVLSFLLSFKIYQNAPTTLYRLPLLLSAVPLSYLFPAARREQRVFTFLTGIYIFRRLDELLAANDSLHRLLLLLVAGTALFGIYLAEQSKDRMAAGVTPRWYRIRMKLLRLAGFILTASLFANIVGSVNLSTLLADACISSAFIGAALAVGILTFEGYLALILQSPVTCRSSSIRNNRLLFQKRCSLLIRLAGLGTWIWISLGLFGIAKPIQELITPLLTKQWALGQVTFSLRSILLFVITIWLAALAARFSGFVLQEDILTRLTLPQGIPATISMLVRNSIIGAGILLALAGAGLKWSQIALVAGAIGVGIGLGLQNLVASYIAGLILIFERPIRVGDAVEIGTVMGSVTRIGLRSSSIRTYDGSEVICPNSKLISQDLVNWTLSSQIRRVELPVNTDYGSDPKHVLEILDSVARRHPGVLQNPEPIALFTGFGDSSLNFVLRFFTSFDDYPVLSSELGIRVNEALRKAGIDIPFPQRDIHIKGEGSTGKGAEALQVDKATGPDIGALRLVPTRTD